jgi:hypothetical protein
MYATKLAGEADVTVALEGVVMDARTEVEEARGRSERWL